MIEFLRKLFRSDPDPADIGKILERISELSDQLEAADGERRLKLLDEKLKQEALLREALNSAAANGGKGQMIEYRG